MVERIYGCKWSLTVYQLLAHGINRPGEMVVVFVPKRKGNLLLESVRLSI